jgi:hypothetical protein
MIPFKTTILDWAGGTFPASTIGQLPPRVTVADEGWAVAISAVIKTLVATIGYDATVTVEPTDDLSGKINIDSGTLYQVPYTFGEPFIL